MLELSMRENIQCSNEEKRGLLPLIDKLVGFAEQARRDGLLALKLKDTNWREQDNALIHLGLKMIVDGLDKVTIREVLGDMIVASNKNGAELLGQYVIMAGLLDIVNGDNPRIIRDHLAAMLGDEVCFEVMAAEKQKPTMLDAANRLPNCIKGINEFLETSEEAAKNYDFAALSNDVLATMFLYLKTELSARVFETLESERHVAIIMKMAEMNFVAADIAAAIQENLHEWKRVSFNADMLRSMDKHRIIAKILKSMSYPRSSSRDLLASIKEKDAGLYDKIRERMFTFEDIAGLNSATIQRALREVKNTDLAIALKMSSDDVKRAVFSNLSERTVEDIKNDMENIGPIRTIDVEERRRRVINVFEKLANEGEIIDPWSMMS